MVLSLLLFAIISVEVTKKYKKGLLHKILYLMILHFADAGFKTKNDCKFAKNNYIYMTCTVEQEEMLCTGVDRVNSFCYLN